MIANHIDCRGAIFAAVLALLVAGCGSTVLGPGDIGSKDGAVALAESSETRLGAGDKIRVTVYGEDKLTGDYDIDPNGFVSLPLAGTIPAAGLTKRELEAALAKQLKSAYLRNPKVTVDVVNFRPYYVLGEVQKPGEYQFRSGLNVLSAIAVAGGATYRANTSKVYIQRSGSTELTEYPQSPTVAVKPGDVLRVPERYF
jgi:protein involved in polysaccharide export with SLBB domain